METVAVSLVPVISIVRGGRLGMTRSGSGLDGALPYWNVVVIAALISTGVSHFSWLPVEPMSVIELKLDGDEGALGTSVSALPDAETDVDGTPKSPS